MAIHDINVTLVAGIMKIVIDSSSPKRELSASLVVIGASVSAEIALGDVKVSMARASILIYIYFENKQFWYLIQ